MTTEHDATLSFQKALLMIINIDFDKGVNESIKISSICDSQKIVALIRLTVCHLISTAENLYAMHVNLMKLN